MAIQFRVLHQDLAMAVEISLSNSPSLGILAFATVDKCVEGAHLLFAERVLNNRRSCSP